MSDHRLQSLTIAWALAAFGGPRAAHAIDLSSVHDAPVGEHRHSTDGHDEPEHELRPDLYFFRRAIGAVKRKQYSSAVGMYETSASWGYKPAQYHLAIMYMTGEGIPIDKPRALAWAALAAERGNDDYVDARELIASELTADEFAEANAIWRELKKTYGDAVALERAKHHQAAIEAKIATPHVGSIVESPSSTSPSNSSSNGEPPSRSATALASEPSWATGTAVEPIEVFPYGGGDAD